MVKTKVSLVTFPNPMVTSEIIPVELLVVFPLSADTVIGKAYVKASINVKISVFVLFIDFPS